MKRFLALLLLLVSPALYAQVDFTDAVNVNNVVTSSSFENCAVNINAPGCGGWVDVGLGDFSNNFGSTEYVFSYTQGTLYQNINLSNYQTNAFNFYFDFDLNNSCRNSIGGYCENVDGPIDPFTAKIYFYDQNGLNNEFTFLSGTPSTANIQCSAFDLFGLCLGGYVALDQWQHFGWYSSVQSDTLFTSARIEFTGRDAGFWGGLYGPRVDNATLQINYLPPPYPTVDGGSGMNVSAPGSDYIFIFKGNDPVLFSQLAILGQDLVGWTAITDTGQDLTITEVVRPDPDYLFLYTDGVPVSGTFYSFQEQPPAVDCVIDPFDPTCIIDTLGIDESPVMVADTTDESLPAEEDPAPAEELLADDMTEEQLTDEEMSDEETLEELLAEESDEEETVTEERILVYRELSDEEKAAILADAISKNTLEAALSVATDAVSSAATTATSEVSLSTESSKSSSASIAISTETSVTNEVVVAMEMSAETTKEETTDSYTTSSLDIFEIGRQLGQEALAVTLAGAESSANESLNEAESIAFNSSNDSVLASMTSIEIAASVETEEQQVANNEAEEETTAEDVVVSEATEIMVAESVVEKTEQNMAEVQQQEVQEEVKVAEVQPQQTIESVAEQKEEIIVAETSSESSTETVEQVVAEVQTEQQSSAVEFTSVEDVMEAFASNINQQAAAAEQEELENNIVQQAIASSQTNDEENKMGFAEAEAVTIASDPALANAFNVQPNTASLELLGVLSNKPEEKSDAELRAEQVVAANKEQQEAINANYMEADQSGILAAIGSETDVTSYRTAMLRDNNNWYKPEDIYKGIIIKDNVRGSYFLEKGNTDTYKKMIEEQYK
jgi:hypothetical protein